MLHRKESQLTDRANAQENAHESIHCRVRKGAGSQSVVSDEYTYRIPNPIRSLSTPKVKVLSTQDKHLVSWVALQSYAAAAAAL